MDKVKIEFQVPENKVIEYNDVKIEITPFLTLAQQGFLIKRYIEEYFHGVGTGIIEDMNLKYLEAEYKQLNYISQLVTNMEISDSLNDGIYSDDILWDTIKDNIINYRHFRERQDRIVQEIKEQIVLDNSIGKVIGDLVDKMHEVLDKFADMSPEEIEELQQKGIELIERLEKSSVVNNALEEKALEKAQKEE